MVTGRREGEGPLTRRSGQRASVIDRTIRQSVAGTLGKSLSSPYAVLNDVDAMQSTSRAFYAMDGADGAMCFLLGGMSGP